MTARARAVAPGGRRANGRRAVAAPFRVVAIPAAIALGSVGGIAAEHAHFPSLLGMLAGALAGALGVLALPSIPTRRVTVVLLGLGGLAALRHASYAGADRSWLLVVWAAATLVALLLVDRADAETVPALDRHARLPNRFAETARVAAVIAVVVAVAAVALVPTVTARLGRHVWPGVDPTPADVFGAPASLQSSPTLDITSRPRLSDAVVFTVDASHPDFWRGETFDVYRGSSWASSYDGESEMLSHDGTKVSVLPELYDPGARNGDEFHQTFHVQAPFSDVVFAAPSARVVETDKAVARRPDGTLVVAGGSAAGFGKGAVYSVVSRRSIVTEATLRASDGVAVPEPVADRYATLGPATTSRRVVDLAHRITAGRTTALDKIRAIEGWLGANTKYSLNAPTSSSADVVDDFLFVHRVGWCEQIASSLVVMARANGIPARLVTGFVPGSRDALTGRFVVRERDAHAWAEIYFPGIGWQGFDPTAAVPLSGDARSGGSWLSDARRNAVPLVLTLLLVAALFAAAPWIAGALRRRRARRASWSAAAMHRLERAGRKAGRERAPSETPREYARVVGERLGDARLLRVGATLDAELYSAHGASAAERDDADAVLSSLRP